MGSRIPVSRPVEETRKFPDTILATEAGGDRASATDGGGDRASATDHAGGDTDASADQTQEKKILIASTGTRRVMSGEWVSVNPFVFSSSFPRVYLVPEKIAAGIETSTNETISTASSEFLGDVFLNSDSVLTRTRVVLSSESSGSYIESEMTPEIRRIRLAPLNMVPGRISYSLGLISGDFLHPALVADEADAARCAALWEQTFGATRDAAAPAGVRDASGVDSAGSGKNEEGSKEAEVTKNEVPAATNLASRTVVAWWMAGFVAASAGIALLVYCWRLLVRRTRDSSAEGSSLGTPGGEQEQ